MKIGVDLDGVIFNSEMFFMAEAELYDVRVLKRNSIIKPDEPRVQNKYSWSKDEVDAYINNFSVSNDFDVMPCAAKVIELLKKAGADIVIISARGQFNKEEVDIAKEKLLQAGITADSYFWGYLNKTDICLKEGIDVMIDDRYDVCETLSEEGIFCLYYHLAGRRKIAETATLKEVYNWGEVYRALHDWNLQNNRGLEL